MEVNGTRFCVDFVCVQTTHQNTEGHKILSQEIYAHIPRFFFAHQPLLFWAGRNLKTHALITVHVPRHWVAGHEITSPHIYL